jgi:hypothetical protein
MYSITREVGETVMLSEVKVTNRVVPTVMVRIRFFWDMDLLQWEIGLRKFRMNVMPAKGPYRIRHHLHGVDSVLECHYYC